MLHSRWSTSLLVLAGTLAAASLHAQEGGTEPRDPTPLEAVENLKARYSRLRAELNEKMRAAGSPKKRQVIWDGRPTRAEDWTPKFWPIAEEHPGTEAAFQALLWIRNHGSNVEESRRALDLLLRDHMHNKGLGAACKRFAGAPRPSTGSGDLAVMRRIRKESPHAAVRGEVGFYLAKCLREKDPDAHEDEIISLLEEAVKHCGEVPGAWPNKDRPLSESARALLFEFRNLRIGKEIPDIVGKDIDGEPMKLSDYRGKVVLLDFWGHW